MKKSNFIYGAIFVLIGILFIMLAVFKESRLGSIFIGLGGGFLFNGVISIFRYFYYSNDKNKEKYLKKLEKERIELHDELKESLRNKSGIYAYIINLIILCISAFVFACLSMMEITISITAFIIYLIVLIILNYVLGVYIYKKLLNKYK